MLMHMIFVRDPMYTLTRHAFLFPEHLPRQRQKHNRTRRLGSDLGALHHQRAYWCCWLMMRSNEPRVARITSVWKRHHGKEGWSRTVSSRSGNASYHGWLAKFENVVISRLTNSICMVCCRWKHPTNTTNCSRDSGQASSPSPPVMSTRLQSTVCCSSLLQR